MSTKTQLQRTQKYLQKLMEEGCVGGQKADEKHLLKDLEKLDVDEEQIVSAIEKETESVVDVVKETEKVAETGEVAEDSGPESASSSALSSPSEDQGDRVKGALRRAFVKVKAVNSFRSELNSSKKFAEELVDEGKSTSDKKEIDSAGRKRNTAKWKRASLVQ